MTDEEAREAVAAYVTAREALREPEGAKREALDTLKAWMRREGSAKAELGNHTVSLVRSTRYAVDHKRLNALLDAETRKEIVTEQTTESVRINFQERITGPIRGHAENPTCTTRTTEPTAPLNSTAGPGGRASGPSRSATTGREGRPRMAFDRFAAGAAAKAAFVWGKEADQLTAEDKETAPTSSATPTGPRADQLGQPLREQRPHTFSDHPAPEGESSMTTERDEDPALAGTPS